SAHLRGEPVPALLSAGPNVQISSGVTSNQVPSSAAMKDSDVDDVSGLFIRECLESDRLPSERDDGASTFPVAGANVTLDPVDFQHPDAERRPLIPEIAATRSGHTALDLERPVY